MKNYQPCLLKYCLNSVQYFVKSKCWHIIEEQFYYRDAEINIGIRVNYLYHFIIERHLFNIESNKKWFRRGILNDMNLDKAWINL